MIIQYLKSLNTFNTIKSCNRTKITSVLTGIGLALSVVYGVSIFAILFISILFLLSTKKSQNNIFSLIFLFNLSYMTIVTLWYKDISAHGWSNIWSLPPQLWLLAFVFVASIVCSIFVALFYKYTYILIKKTKISLNNLLNVYIWGLVMTFVEILRAMVFSVITKTGDSPIEPMWNMYSVVQIIDKNTAVLSRAVGMWGMVFLVFTIGATLAICINLAAKKQYNNMYKILFYSIVFVLVLGHLSTVKLGNNKSSEFNIIAVQQSSNDINYLKDIVDAEIGSNTPTLIVLPEYSNLFHPYANSISPVLNLDYRYIFPTIYNNKNIYFAGTEDVYESKNRTVESYLTNGSLKKIKRIHKTYLIPGGEYLPGWITKTIAFFDGNTLSSFANRGSRTVTSFNLEIDEYNENSKLFAIGACSSVLTPYNYREQVNDGALVLSSNVSFEQFINAPQYEKIANKFAMLNSVMNNRPFAVGARSGYATIYDNSGNILAKTISNRYVEEHFKQSQAKTIYTVLGDKIILLLLSAPFLVFILFYLIRSKIKN